MGRFQSLLLDRRFFQKSFPRNRLFHVKRAPVTAYGNNIRDIGLLIGSLISILFSKRFSIKKSVSANKFWYLKDITNRKSVWSFTFDHTLLYFTVQYPEFLP